jgi:excisionase family DNA binding protein
MSTIVPIAFQITEEQKQAISKIAASVAPLLGPYDGVLLTLVLHKGGVEKTGDQTTERQATVPETLIPPKQETFTVAQAAQFLNVNPATVYRLIYLGHLKVLRSFGRLRISRQRLLSQTEIYTPRRRRRK